MKSWKRSLTIVLMGLLVATRPDSAASYQATCSIRGVIVRASGAPAASVWVLLTSGDQERGRSLTSDDGRYYVEQLQAGAYVMAVRRGDTTLAELQVTVSGDDVRNITLP